MALLPWQMIDAYLKARGVKVGGPTVGMTTGGTHASNSLHYLGRARDYGPNTGSDPEAIVRALLPLAVPGGPIVQLFYSPMDVFIQNGKRVPDATIKKQGLREGHYGHVHVGIAAGPSGLALTPAGAAAGGLAILIGAGLLGLFAVRVLRSF